MVANLPRPARFTQLGQLPLTYHVNEIITWIRQQADGATSVADGGTITHGLSTTPTVVLVTPSVAGEMASVTAISATTFTVALRTHAGAAGTTQTVYWQARV